MPKYHSRRGNTGGGAIYLDYPCTLDACVAEHFHVFSDAELAEHDCDVALALLDRVDLHQP